MAKRFCELFEAALGAIADGFCPFIRHNEERADGRLFNPAFTYQFMQLIRRRLKERGIDLSWNFIRWVMAGQCRVTASFRRAAGADVRKAARASGYLSRHKS